MAHQQNIALLQALNECVAACNHCFTACLEEADVKMMTGCIKLDADCTDICALTAQLIARNSPHGTHLLKECAEVCDACAAECNKHAAHMEHCKACATACTRCAAACREAA